MVDPWRRLARPISASPDGTTRWSRRRPCGFSAIVHVSPVRSDGPGRAPDNGRSRHAARTTTNARTPTSGYAERHARVAAQARTACGAPERTKNYPHHDVPYRDCDVRRSRKFDAAASPSRHIPSHSDRSAAVLPHQRVRELPRGRPDPRDRAMPDLWLHTSSALARPD